MAATKFAFITQPNNTVQGFTLQGGLSNLQNLLGVAGQFDTLLASPGIMVANVDNNGVLVPTDTSVPTIAIGTNPTSGSTISGTLVGTPVGGISTFTDLAISLGGNGYTITATGSLTTATSNAFNVATVKRVNPIRLTGSPSATTLTNAIGPYRIRAGRTPGSVRVGFTSTNTTDVAQIVLTEPGVALSTNSAMVPKTTNYSGSLTAPAYVVLDIQELGGNVDLYVYTTTQTGTPSVVIERVEAKTSV